MMTERAGIPSGGEDDEYRDSHIERGASYDATLDASPFDAYMTRWEVRRLGERVRGLYPGGIPRYLDFACGTGRIMQALAPFARESVGVDVSASMLEQARAKNAGTRFVEADLTRERVELGQFDLITSFRFFGNAQDALRREVLNVLARLLRPGGHLIVNNHRNPLSLSALAHRATGGRHGMDLSYYKLRVMLKEQGLRVAGVQPIGFWLWRARMQRRTDILEASEAWEARFASAVCAPFAPDMIVVAQRSLGHAS